jgi:hypothetical protein
MDALIPHVRLKLKIQILYKNRAQLTC